MPPSLRQTGTPSDQSRPVYVVVDPQLSIRPTYSLGVRPSRQLQLNERIAVDREVITASGYIWRRHDTGWTIEGRVSKPELYLIPLSDDPELHYAGPSVKLPDEEITLEMPPLFVSLPVALAETTWVQFFGNTRFASYLRQQTNERRRGAYNFCQGLHGGLDFGNTGRNESPSIVHAGVLNGIVSEVATNSNVYRSGVVRIRIGIFTLIYGHLANVARLTVGQQVRPDTVLGEIDLKEQFHLHLEVRLRLNKRDYLVNPLNMMPPALRDPLLAKFSAFDQHFYHDRVWRQWQTPLDQPVLKVTNARAPELIGPFAQA